MERPSIDDVILEVQDKWDEITITKITGDHELCHDENLDPFSSIMNDSIISNPNDNILGNLIRYTYLCTYFDAVFWIPANFCMILQPGLTLPQGKMY